MKYIAILLVALSMVSTQALANYQVMITGGVYCQSVDDVKKYVTSVNTRQPTQVDCFRGGTGRAIMSDPVDVYLEGKYQVTIRKFSVPGMDFYGYNLEEMQGA